MMLGDKFASFDVFDTVFVRRLGDPTGAFLLLAAELQALRLSDTSKEDFRRMRISAERVAATAKSREGGPTIQEIYREMARLIGWDEEQGTEALLTEFRIENEIVFVVPEIHRLIAAARASGRKVVFLSDMYWSSSDIKRLLLNKGVACEEDAVFTSADMLVGKSSGRLYKKALGILGGSPKEMSHVGNNGMADLAGAKRVGIAAYHYADGNLTHREQLLLRDPGNLFDQYLAGVARICRLKNSAAKSGHLDVLTSVTATVAMPTLLCYALWVVREADEKGIKRLVFVSRDGWLLKKIVEKAMHICSKHFECIFIYGSRQAWHGAAIQPETVESCTWLFEGRDTLTLQRLFRRLGILDVTQRKFADQLGLSLCNDEVLDEAQLQKVLVWFRAAATGNGDLAELLKNKRASVVSYLRQEGIISDCPAAIVDLGWAGRLQDSLNSIVEQEGGRSLSGLFLGIAKDAKTGPHLRAAFLFDFRTQRCEFASLAGVLQVLESFCTQRQGTVLGYERDSTERWQPIFRVQEEKALIEWGIDHVHQVAENYLTDLPDNCGGKDEELQMLTARARRIIKEFMVHPTEREAQEWGAFPFEHEQSGGRPVALATAFPGPVSTIRLAFRVEKGFPIEGYWRRASILMTPWWRQILARILLRVIERIKLT